MGAERTAGKGAVEAEAQQLMARAIDQVGTGYHRALTSGRELLRQMGPAGEELASKIDLVTQETKTRVGPRLVRLRTLSEGMSREERYNWTDVMEARSAPRHDRIATAAAEMADILDKDYSEEAMNLGLREFVGPRYEILLRKKEREFLEAGMPAGEARSKAEAVAARGAKVPFAPIANYFPHYNSQASLEQALAIEGNPAREKVLRALMAQYGQDRKVAGAILDRFRTQPPEFRGGPLQHVRTLVDGAVGYERDPVVALSRYFIAGEKRLSTARVFGARDEVAMNLLNEIKMQQGADKARLAHNLYLAFTGNAPKPFGDLAKAAGIFHSITLLSTAGLLQPAQVGNTIARAGWVNSLRGMAYVFMNRKKSDLFAEEAGALIDTIRNDLMVESVNDLPAVWSRVIGLEQLDRFNRVHAAVTGRYYAMQLAKKAREGMLTAVDKDVLGMMGLDAGEIAQGITPEHMRQAGLWLSTNTQFASQVMDLPELRNSPMGPFLYLFKSFSLQQARFVKSMALQARDTGDVGPLIRYVSVMGGVAQLLPPVIRAIKGREKPEEDWAEQLENLAMVGSLGAWWDWGRAMNSGPDAVFNWALGPTAGEATQLLGSDIPAAAQGIAGQGESNFEPLVKHLVSRTPLVGPWLKNVWWKENF